MLDSNDQETGTVWRDLSLAMWACLLFIVIIMLPHVNPVGRDKEAEAVQPGNIAVEIRWPDRMDVDVDLWVQAPGDIPVGYSNLVGRIFNLLRDDLGMHGDALGLNYETSYSRGCPLGEYQANVYYYRGSEIDVPVTMAIHAKRLNEKPQQLFALSIKLKFVGNEVTVARWTMDQNCKLVEDSFHTLHRPIARALSSGG